MALLGFGAGAAQAGAVSVAAGVDHTCALKGDGSATCWGRDLEGQATVPIGLAGVSQLAAGALHTCAVRNDGSATCWGNNGSGQATVPPGLAGVTQLAAGSAHTCALKGDGSATCWANDDSGQLGAAPGVFVGAVPAAVYDAPFTHAIGRSGVPGAAIHPLGGKLPPGVSLDPQTGGLTGTPIRAGSYTLRVAAFNVLGASLAVPVTVVVARAPLTVTATSHSITAGAPLPALDATLSGLVAGDTRATALTTPARCTAAGAGATPTAGRYPITCTGASASNYAIAYKPGTLTVTAATPTPTPTPTPEPEPQPELEPAHAHAHHPPDRRHQIEHAQRARHLHPRPTAT